MRPGQEKGSVVFESLEDIDITNQTLLSHGAVVTEQDDTETGADCLALSWELFTNASMSVGVEAGVYPSELIIASFRTVISNPNYLDARTRQRAAEIYRDYQTKALEQDKGKMPSEYVELVPHTAAQ